MDWPSFLKSIPTNLLHTLVYVLMGISFIIYGMEDDFNNDFISDKWERFLNHVLIKQVDQK